MQCKWWDQCKQMINVLLTQQLSKSHHLLRESGDVVVGSVETEWLQTSAANTGRWRESRHESQRERGDTKITSERSGLRWFRQVDLIWLHGVRSVRTDVEPVWTASVFESFLAWSPLNLFTGSKSLIWRSAFRNPSNWNGRRTVVLPLQKVSLHSVLCNELCD